MELQAASENSTSAEERAETCVPATTPEELATADRSLLEQEPHRGPALQEALIAARSLERSTTNGCVVAGASWLCGWLGLILTGGSFNVLTVIALIPLIGAPFVLALYGAARVYSEARRRSVLGSARSHGLVLRDPGADPPRWTVLGSAPSSAASQSPGEALDRAEAPSSPGARLEEKLARDRQERQSVAAAFQRKLDGAAALESFGRRVCALTGAGSLPLWVLAVSTGLRASEGDIISPLLAALVGVVAVALPVGTLLVAAAKLWRRGLLKQARAQALEVVEIARELP